MADDLAARTPPGQYLTRKFPVLTYGPTPALDTEDWTLEVYGAVEEPLVLSWSAFLALPQVERVSDFHCVTTWSRLDNRWEGVPVRELLDRARPTPEATHVMVHAYGGYTTNLPLEVLYADDALIAHGHDGAPLTREHGYPARLVVPELYAWKSAKWVRALELMTEDRPGFWERNGYSTTADPWREDRYW